MKKKKNRKQAKKNLRLNKTIIALIVIGFLIVILVPLFFLIPSNKEKIQSKEIFMGEPFSLNASANMVDYLYNGQNIVFSPINANTSLTLIYNGTDNTSKKEIRRYFDKGIPNDYLISYLNNLNTTSTVTKKDKYEKLMNTFIEKDYANLRVKDLEKLGQREKEELILLIKKIELYYNQKLKSKEIEKYSLSDKERNYNGYVIKELIDNLMVQYETYTINNTVNNYNELYYSNKNKITFEKEYLNTLKQYNVNLTSLDFNSKESDNIINNNLYNRTKNQITRAISDSNLTDESLVSINSLYFNYKWDNIFNSENIIDEEFTDINDKHYMVDMMYSEETIYLENSFATGFIKDFEGEKYSFVGILPKEKGEYKLSEINIQSLIESKKEVKTFIGLPKFSINSLNNLTELYNSYGIKEIFYSGANLHQMSTRNLYVAKMIQKEKITIGEYGTEEGKTKTESLSTSIIEDNTKKVILNRPFAFLIIDKETNEVLLIGKYNNPN
ncbi:MAG: hypothetical protein II625_04455 [Bacilli bacterium]|nr:hypothetical protein [Bacilli bacterium]